MCDEDLPNPPDEKENGSDLPAAVQWMMEQAAAGESPEIEQLPATTGPWQALAPETKEAVLIARERRIRDALRGNERLTEGLAGPAAEALLGLGLNMGRVVVRDTKGLDDAAAEAILQMRVRAVRRLMLAASQATHEEESAAGTKAVVAQAAIALGDKFSMPGEAEINAFQNRWRSLAGRPEEQINDLRRFIEDHTGGRR